ncbi:hypothetical protein Xen7305DRAFT_00037170 [Xenococcus sp. PCC 7305]|uniref:DUF4912 domain-containing protein n=1 Tax=Xenococcus sp. PCC 7305 TaxID=102125 RepID=UPI0002ACCFB8|nr:DUF4912 domain-containing protein [Xenococcus sp. PCC 7305]ELS03989.1 hypothetical protein Xen7305DRAFT_00037170 [Xenococcus sp. PCC 7305]
MAKERPPLEEMTLRQLRKVASEYNVSRYSRMRKAQLLTSIKEAMKKVETEKSDQGSSLNQEEQQVKSTKFEVGQETPEANDLSSVDQDLGELPAGYGQSRIVLLPRDPQWAYCYWDVPNEHKEEFRRQGGQQLALRLYDITDINLDYQAPHNIQEYLCDEMAREWYLPLPVSDRDYIVDIGYRCGDGRWMSLARSAAVRVPPVYPSDWIEDNFVTVGWEQELKGKNVFTLVPPSKKPAPTTSASDSAIYDQIFGMAESAESMRVAGSGVGQEALSSYVFPSGVGKWAIPTPSGINMSGVGMNVSGLSSIPPARPRKFWLVADAELIVYGATEPDATVTIGDRKIELSPDGTFRFQMSFQDGVIDYPIVAVASDGEQTRSVHMNFERETPSRNTNTKEEAVEEWFA